MGQYYIAVAIDPDGKYHYVRGFMDYGSQLTEHAFDDARILRVVENLLRPGGKWYRWRIVWAGDYADPEENSEYNLYHMPDKIYDGNTEPLETSLKYVVNHTKKLYTDNMSG